MHRLIPVIYAGFRARDFFIASRRVFHHVRVNFFQKRRNSVGARKSNVPPLLITPNTGATKMAKKHFIVMTRVMRLIVAESEAEAEAHEVEALTEALKRDESGSLMVEGVEVEMVWEQDSEAVIR